MQNMTMKKLLFVFGGFMLAIIVITAVIAALTAKKSTAPHAVQRHAQQHGSAEPASAPVLDASFGTVSPSPAPAYAPATAPRVVPIQAPAAASAASASDQSLAKVDTELSDHEARITALESQRAASGKPAHASTSRPTSARVRDSRLLSREAEQELLHPTPPNRVASDYHTLAVVGDRAWVSAKDGATESVVVGDELPRPRVKAIRADTGAVLTSSDTTVPPGH